MNDSILALTRIDIDLEDALALRRISMTLHRWHELECGDSNRYCSWCITRGHQREGGPFQHREDGRSYMETHCYNQSRPDWTSYRPIPDREKGAQRRLAKIMARYPGLTAYIQGDPRGAALYILRPGDVPEGASVDSCYSRGIAVYK